MTKIDGAVPAKSKPRQDQGNPNICQMSCIKPLLASLSRSIKAGLVRIERSIRSQSTHIMKFTVPTLLLAAPVLGHLLYDAPFIGNPDVVARTTSKGATCVGIFQIHKDSTNILHQCSVLQTKLGSQVSFPGSATFSREQNDTIVGYVWFPTKLVFCADPKLQSVVGPRAESVPCL